MTIQHLWHLQELEVQGTRQIEFTRAQKPVAELGNLLGTSLSNPGFLLAEAPHCHPRLAPSIAWIIECQLEGQNYILFSWIARGLVV